MFVVTGATLHCGATHVPLLERGIFTTCELLGRGKHRGKGKMPDYSGNLPCIRQVNQLVFLLGQGRFIKMTNIKLALISSLFYEDILYHQY